MAFPYKTLLLFILCFWCHQLLAQNHNLLWYKGKKLSDTSILTNSGQRVTYSPRTGRVRVSNSTNTSAINNRLQNSEAFKKQVVQIITGGTAGAKNIDLANRAIQTIEEVDRMMQESINSVNEITIDNLPGNNSSSALLPEWVQNYFDEVVNYVIRDKAKEKTVPEAPPAVSFDYCFPCDAERKQKYAADTARYFSQFSNEHAGMISKGFKVIGYFQHRIYNVLPYDSISADRMINKMRSDIEYLLNEISGKVSKSWNLYKNDASRLPVLIQLVHAVTRQFQLMGMAVPSSLPGLEEIGRTLLTTMAGYFDDALQKRDYPVLLNISWYMGLIRQATLILGDNISVSEKISRFMAGNRFEMMVDAEARLGTDGTLLSAKMTGSNYYRAVPDKDCKLRWHLYEPFENKMKFTLEEAEIKIEAPASYTGTRDWQTPPADIQLGFCERPVRDTLLMQNFMPNGKESWVIQGQAAPGGYVMSIFNSCFMDEKRVMAAAGDKQKFERIQKELMEEYNKAIAGNEELLSKDPATMTKDERERLQKLVAASQSIQQKMTDAATSHNLLFKESVQNNLKTVFEKELDGKILFPKNTSIQHAKFKVRLVHVE